MEKKDLRVSPGRSQNKKKHTQPHTKPNKNKPKNFIRLTQKGVSNRKGKGS